MSSDTTSADPITDALISAIQAHPEQPSATVAARMAGLWRNDFFGAPIGLIPDIVRQRLAEPARHATLRQLVYDERLQEQVRQTIATNARVVEATHPAFRNLMPSPWPVPEKGS